MGIFTFFSSRKAAPAAAAAPANGDSALAEKEAEVRIVIYSWYDIMQHKCKGMCI